MTTTTSTGRTNRDLSARRTYREAEETKPSWKTTELLVFVLAVIGVLVASAMTDDGDGGAFGAETAWWYITLLTIGYMVARGLAKAGSNTHDHDPRTSGEDHDYDRSGLPMSANSSRR
jgi:hypothetical protein